MPASIPFLPSRLPWADFSPATLFNRRLLQFLGVYLAAAWPVFQFVNWLVDYYVLSPHLVELFLFAVLLMLPAVLLVAHARGTEYPERAARLVRVGVPCNVLGVAAVLALLFGGKDLGSARQLVTMTTLEGETVERVVPKSTFRKRVALFYFDNETGDPDADWLRSGLSDALSLDLTQDLFLTVHTPASFTERLAEGGFADGFGVPLALRREIAREYRLDHLLDGAVARSEVGSYRLTTRLYATASGRLVETRTFEGDDLLALVDRAAVQLKHDLEIPSGHVEETTDLPVAEVLTSSPEAWRAYAEASHRVTFASDYAGAEGDLDRAVAADPTFAFAHLMRGVTMLYQGRMPEALAAYREADRHGYRLPERFRLLVNTGILNLQNRPEEALQAARQWRTLFPDDPMAVGVLAQLHTLRGETDEALEARRRLLELDPAETGQLLEIGDLLLDENRYEDARAAYRRYVDAAPEETDGYLRLGRLHLRTGDLDAERDAYRQALALDAGNPEIVARLADADLKAGRFDEAERQYRRALELARTPQEEASATFELAGYHLFRGRRTAYREAMRAGDALQAGYLPPLHLVLRRTGRAMTLAENGFVDDARSALAEAQAHPAMADPTFAAFVDLGEAGVWVETGRAAEVPARLDSVAARLNALGARQDYGIDALRARALQRAGRLEAAVDVYRAELESDPHVASTWRRLGETFHTLGRPADAREAFDEALRRYPSSPKTHLALARLLAEAGRPADARRHLARALDAWPDADTDFAPAAEARALLEALPGA